MSKIGEAIRAERKRRRMTIEELAETLEVSVNSLSNWERGVRKPDEVNRWVIQNKLGIVLPEVEA